MADQRTLVAPAGAGRVDRWLAEVLPLSRSRLQALISEGRVCIGGRPLRASHRLGGGESVTVSLPEEPVFGLVAQDLGVPLLYQDPHLLVVFKPAGMVVHPAHGNPDGTLVNALLPALTAVAPEDDEAPDALRPGIVHRLDRGTSGVLVVARTPAAREALSAQLAAHSVDRRYLAVVWGEPAAPAGTIDAPLGRDPRHRKRFAVVPDGKRAVTHWRLAGAARFPVPGDRAGAAVSLVVCRLETGRTHQIRVHLSQQDLPLVGDPLYRRRGARVPVALAAEASALDHQLLHAWRLGFAHPATGEWLSFDAPPPPDLQRFAEAAGLGPALRAAVQP